MVNKDNKCGLWMDKSIKSVVESANGQDLWKQTVENKLFCLGSFLKYKNWRSQYEYTRLKATFNPLWTTDKHDHLRLYRVHLSTNILSQPAFIIIKHA